MHKSLFLSAVALLSTGLCARAETLDFNLTANNTAGCSYMPTTCITSVLNFQVAQSPVPSSYNANTFTVNNVQVVENTLPFPNTALPITFSVNGVAPDGGFAFNGMIYGMFSFDFHRSSAMVDSSTGLPLPQLSTSVPTQAPSLISGRATAAR